jgi:hypothetical protein
MPGGCGHRAAPGRLVDDGGVDAEDRRKGPTGVAEDLHPQVGDPRPGARHRGPPAATGEGRGGDPDGLAHTGDEGRQRYLGRPGLPALLCRAAQGLHECAAAEDADVAPGRGPGAAASGEPRPASVAAEESALSRKRSPMATSREHGRVNVVRTGGRTSRHSTLRVPHVGAPCIYCRR